VLADPGFVHKFQSQEEQKQVCDMRGGRAEILTIAVGYIET